MMGESRKSAKKRMWYYKELGKWGKKIRFSEAAAQGIWDREMDSQGKGVVLFFCIISVPI